MTTAQQQKIDNDIITSALRSYIEGLHNAKPEAQQRLDFVKGNGGTAGQIAEKEAELNRINTHIVRGNELLGMRPGERSAQLDLL